MKALTLANFVTLSRLLLLAPVIYFLTTDERVLSIIFLALVLFGALIDGAIARSRGEVSELGKILDPLVDKLVFVSLFIALALMGELPVLALLLLLLFQVGIVIGALHQILTDRAIQGARPMGKIASLAISAGLITVVMELELSHWVLYGGIMLVYVAGLDYLINWIRILRERPQAKARSSRAQMPSEESP